MFQVRASRPDEGERVVCIWRAAVEATHDFLLDEDRAGIDVDARAYLLSTPLWVAVDRRDRPIAFMAIGESRLDALFVAPEYRGRGVGQLLVRFAASRYPVLDTEVNLQNGQAVGFYLRLGFLQTGHSPVDDHGRPYPLIRMRLNSGPSQGADQ
jgi:putative acetyltransferase